MHFAEHDENTHNIVVSKDYFVYFKILLLNMHDWMEEKIEGQPVGKIDHLNLG